MNPTLRWRSVAWALTLILPILLAPPAPGSAAPARGEPPFADFDPGSVPRPERGAAKPVARVFDRYISRDSLGRGNPDQLGSTLMAFVMTELMRRYAIEGQLEATPEEIDDLLRVLRERDPSDYENLGEDAREFAARLVTQWKIDRALHARYGGTVIFQQMNPFEPVGAYHDFLREMEKRKIVEIYDRRLTRGFWKYLVMDHPFQIPPERVDFNTPWWLQDTADEAAEQAQREPPAPATDVPAEGYTVTGTTVRFVFDPSLFNAATDGSSGAWASLGSIGIRTVHLAGDFNGWSTSSWLMRPVGPTGSIYVLDRTFDELGGPGRHEFKFVVNGAWWVEPVARAPNRAETNLGNRSGNLVIVIP